MTCLRRQDRLYVRGDSSRGGLVGEPSGLPREGSLPGQAHGAPGRVGEPSPTKSDKGPAANHKTDPSWRPPSRRSQEVSGTSNLFLW